MEKFLCYHQGMIIMKSKSIFARETPELRRFEVCVTNDIVIHDSCLLV